MVFVKLSNYFDGLPTKAISSVLRLFFRRNPSAVARLITQRVINSVNGQIFFVSVLIRPLFKIIKNTPFITNFYVCAAVLWITKRFWIVTSLVNSVPNAIKSCAAMVVSCKSLPAATRAAIVTLMSLVTASIKNALTPKTGKFKVFSGSHTPPLYC